MSTSVPGFYSFIQGEGNAEGGQAEAIQRLNAHDNFLRNLCNEILYSNPEYNTAFQRFYSHLTRELNIRDNQHPPIIPRRNLALVLTYFYNRQFIIQMMSQPIPFPGGNIHVPIDRNPNKQLIADILALTGDQVAVNYNLPYLVVITDPFTRFVWAHPVGFLTSEQVKKAFFLAFSRPGLPYEFYQLLRDKVTQVVVDGGSEFKNTFPSNLHFAFPHAVLVKSQPKSSTAGRPTNTGPVEAAIGMIRRVLRKYEFTQDRNFLRGNNQGGLTQVLNMVNNASSQPLNHQTPTQVVEAILENDVKYIQYAQVFMKRAQNRVIRKRSSALARIGNPHATFWIATEPHGSFAYRLYIPPPSFSKLVTIKVSKEVYVIKNRNVGEKGMQVELQIYGENNNEERIGKIVNWQQLVLVRTPVDPGPPQVQVQLQQQIKDLAWVGPTPQQITQAFQIPPEIRQAVGQESPNLARQLDTQTIDRNPIHRNRRVGVRAPARYQD